MNPPGGAKNRAGPSRISRSPAAEPPTSPARYATSPLGVLE